METGMTALTLSVGPISVAVEYVILLTALLVAAGVGRFVGRFERSNIDDVLLSMLLVAALTARIAFVALWFDQYRAQPWTMLDIRDGGFNGWAGVGAGIVYLAVCAWRNAPLRKSLAVGSLAGVLVWWAVSGVLDMTGRAMLPAVALTTLAGAPTSLASMAGKPIVVNLWASWCPPCLL